MLRILNFCEILEKIIIWSGRSTSWASLILVAVTLFDVISRRFFVLGSTKLQEAEWHLHTVLLMFVIAYGCLKDTHVRIDLVREQQTTRAKAWIDFVGGLTLLIPYSLLILYTGFGFVKSSFILNEVSASMTGLPYRWVIKATVLVAFILVLMAGISILIRHALYLFFGHDESVLKSRIFLPVRVKTAGSDDGDNDGR